MIAHSVSRSLLVVLAVLGVAHVSFADCAPVRPATAEEKKIYADGLAMFQRMAPPAPAGWTASDSPRDRTITEVCADAGQRVTRWGFTRQYDRNAEEQQKRLEVATQKMMALMKTAPIDMTGLEAQTKAIEAEQQKDVLAMFSVVIDEASVDTGAFSPTTVPVGSGYLQAFDESNGNPHVDLKIVLPPPAGGVGSTVVQFSGDPARVDALHKAAKLP